ncbi:NfeD family protein [Algoriphagus sp. AK58]|uniref:NfeD family protein n=1 Tax=Algoriphagus sp. AK58 TaxID=1406877 RepID=UPI001650D1A2|nr:NfeD family protein [Algoriphagus sp. AK58]MBC6368814.1 nodulation protein NfeD [Algoriphagus sp. AK58]
MEILILSSLLITGLILLLLEILFIPGTTVVGIFGFLVSLAGLVYAFLTFEYSLALWITGVALALNFAAVWYGFSSGVWKKFSLKSSMTGGAFDGRTSGLEVGMMGTTVSDIKPFGKALFSDELYEVKSESGFIEVGKTVEIVKIENNKIIVK